MMRVGPAHRQLFTTQLVDVYRGRLLGRRGWWGSADLMGWLSERGTDFRDRMACSRPDISGSAASGYPRTPSGSEAARRNPRSLRALTKEWQGALGRQGPREADQWCVLSIRVSGRRRGPDKAAVAVAQPMVETAWYLSTTGALRYEDPGADGVDRGHDPATEAKRLSRRIERRIEAGRFAVAISETARVAALSDSANLPMRRPAPRAARPRTITASALRRSCEW